MFKKRTIPVTHGSDVRVVRRAAAEASRAVGFANTVCEEIALAANELATNLIKHAVEGIVRVEPVNGPGPPGIQITSIDRGPGIADTERAVMDGYSTSGSLGCGLGTVNRLMDELEIASPGSKAGARITCRRFVQALPTGDRPPLDVGAATRPHPGMKMNGDAFVIKTGGFGVLTAVIDGLGHGQHAHRAAQKARQYIERHPQQSLEYLFRGVARECQATRGVVMTLARFSYSNADQNGGPINRNARPVTFTAAGIGNIEMRLHRAPEVERIVQRRGILGRSVPDPKVIRQLWPPGALMVLYSDGLRSHWKWDQFETVLDGPATRIARQMVYELARDHDDATAVVIKWKDVTDA